MADPRIYQASLGDGADPSRGLALARRLLAASGKPASGISVWASLSPPSVAGAARILPEEILSADLALEPDRIPALVEALRPEPGADNWFLVQRASAFGSPFGLGTTHPSRRDESSATAYLDFGDEPVPDAIASGRFGRWLEALASAGLLPATIQPSQLMDRFATEFRQRREPPGAARRAAGPPADLPQPFELAGVRVSGRGWRFMRGDRDSYWPAACQLGVGVKPAAALSLTAPLFAAGGPVEFHGYYSACALGAAGLAGRLAEVGTATFVLHTTDSDRGCVADPTVDALLGAVGDDLVCVEWTCDWPEAAPGYNGVQLTVNGVGNLHDDDAEHVPGTAAVYLTVHPRTARGAGALASALGKLAGVRLRAMLGRRQAGLRNGTGVSAPGGLPRRGAWPGRGRRPGCSPPTRGRRPTAPR